MFEASRPRLETKSNIPVRKKNVPVAARAMAVAEAVILAPIWGKQERQAFPVTLRAG